MVVSAFVDVEAPGAKVVKVRYGSGKDDALETPDLAVGSDGRVTAVLLGLRPKAKHQIVVEARADALKLRSEPLTFQADPWPSDVGFPQLELKVDDGSARGFLLGAYRTPKGRLAVMLDRRGRPVWYRPIVGEAVLGAFSRLPNGNFVMWNLATRVFEEVNLAGWVVRRWVIDPPASTEGADGHEFQPLPGDRALVIGWHSSIADSRKLFKNGVADAERRDNTIVEIDAAGAARMIWSTKHIALDELQPLREFEADPKHFEIAHVNSIDLSEDGQLVVVTCREIGQVLAIERATGRVRFRLGGKRGDVRISDDSLGGFSAPHDARLLPGNRIRIFDNGNLHEPPVSRVVIYELDEAKRTAKLVWEYRHEPPIYTHVAGSARDGADGRLIINYSWWGVITEIDAERRVHWEAVTPYSGAYRIEWVPTLYPR